MTESKPRITVHELLSPEVHESSVGKLQAQVEALLYENSKLKKINHVLTQRVEMGWGNNSDPYRSFENAALLADKVKERTRQLQRTLQDLEQANAKLSNFQEEAQKSAHLLHEVIESIPESYVMFDSDKRLVMANKRFFQFWKQAGIDVVVGETTSHDLQKQAVRLGLVDNSNRTREIEGFPKQRMQEVLFRLQNNHWMQMTEKPIAGGGLVVLYSDITPTGESGDQRQEKALAEQARLLQNTLENMSLGVALVNGEGLLETWNPKFIELCGLHGNSVSRHVNFDTLLADTELAQLPRPSDDGDTPGSVIYFGELTLANGCVLLVRRHVIEGGGFLDTYADYTDRFYNQAALRESEHRIRLITDALPAMISYVNKNLDYEFVNKSFEDWFEKPRDQICGKAMAVVLGEDSYTVHRPYIEGALGGRTVNFEVSQSNGDKESRDFRKTFIPHFSADRSVVGFFALEQDITAQRRTAQALQQAYEYMEKRVNARTHEISAINLQLRQEITERQQIEASLIEAKKVADQANESKTRFLAAASHDLLQPMNAARLFATALRDQALSEEAEQLVDSLGYSLENVEALISSLVDISKLEAGVVEAAPESFHIDDLLHKLAAEYRPQAHKIGLDLDYIPSKAVVFSDSQLLARVLRNLLSNAIRYTPEGKLVLGCRRRQNGLEIQVLDTGIGIEGSKLGEIFREFSRIDAARTRTDKGIGLGLAIVERLSRVLGHEIRVQSNPGKGSCFSLMVPYGKAVAPAVTAPIELDAVGLPIRDARILVVDNDIEICEGMQALLSTWHCRVMAAQSVAQLQEDAALVEFQPQLMIADYHLDNGETGLQAIKAVKTRLGCEIPVILITADYSNELRLAAKNAGYVLLNKPVKPLKLKMLMSNFLRKSKKRNGEA